MKAIIFPMAGESSRFTKAGFTMPKYMLDVNGETLFRRCVNSFNKYFSTHRFVFILNKKENIGFIELEIKELDIKDYQISLIQNKTMGQAHTVFLGLEKLLFPESAEITIFNIDSIRWDFEFKPVYNNSDGVLEVFQGKGESWSFVQPGKRNLALRTTEKDRISNLCSTGLYYFKEYDLFKMAFNHAKLNNELTKGEYYIAPLYNLLIQKGFEIRYSEVQSESVDFLGTPDEYFAFIRRKANNS